MRFLIRLLVTAASLWVAVRLVPGIDYQGEPAGLLGVALVFGVINAIVRPILFMLTFPLVLITLGLFIFVLNALMLLLASTLAQALGLGFAVAGFVPALLGALVVGIVSTVLSVFVGENERR